jgi:hypothetical protein
LIVSRERKRSARLFCFRLRTVITGAVSVNRFAVIEDRLPGPLGLAEFTRALERETKRCLAPQKQGHKQKIEPGESHFPVSRHGGNPIHHSTVLAQSGWTILCTRAESGGSSIVPRTVPTSYEAARYFDPDADTARSV